MRRLVLSLVALLSRADSRCLRLGDERLPRQGCRCPAEVRGADDGPDDEGDDGHQHESGVGVGFADAARRRRRTRSRPTSPQSKPPADKQPLADQLVGAYRTLAKASLDLKAALDTERPGRADQGGRGVQQGDGRRERGHRRVQRRRLGVGRVAYARSGEVAEWLKAAVSKTVMGLTFHRGFESPPLRLLPVNRLAVGTRRSRRSRDPRPA